MSPRIRYKWKHVVYQQFPQIGYTPLYLTTVIPFDDKTLLPKKKYGRQNKPTNPSGFRWKQFTSNLWTSHQQFGPILVRKDPRTQTWLENRPMHLFYCQIIIGCTSLSLYGCFLKWGYPQINPNHPFYVRIFHEINHRGTLISGNPNIPKKDLKKKWFPLGVTHPPESPMKNSAESPGEECVSSSGLQTSPCLENTRKNHGWNGVPTESSIRINVT